ncbi:hypothetical protein D3C81_992250 [compost metagenome]
MTAFPHLFSPLEIRGKRLKNRIMSTGHDTSMPTDNLVTTTSWWPTTRRGRKAASA